MPRSNGTQAEAAAGDDRRPLLMFVHIPKTAGTTVRAILNLNYPGPQSRALSNVFKGAGGSSEGSVARLRERPLNLKGVRLVRGHVPLGIDSVLTEQVKSGREVSSFAFLRNPADRILSHYFRIRERSEGSYDLPPLAPDATLQDALAGGYLHDNLQTRMLSGLAEPFGEVDEAMLEQAKINLSERLTFFGLTERFDESLVLARRRLGLGSVLYRSSGRVNAARPRGDQIPAELRAAAEECNAYDNELYQHAAELFESAPERAGLDFEVEVAALRAARAQGEIDLEVPAPERFEGGAAEWRMLLRAEASSIRSNWQVEQLSSPRGSARTNLDELRAELEKAEEDNAALEQKVSELETALAKASQSRSGPGKAERKARKRSAEPGASKKRKRATDDQHGKPARAKQKRAAKQRPTAGDPETGPPK